MIKYADITGQRFGKLVVKSQNTSIIYHKTDCYCKCDCGGSVTYPYLKLTGGFVTSCGCEKEDESKWKFKSIAQYRGFLRRLNLVGQKFGKLTVISSEGMKNGETSFLCRCDCGNERVVSGGNLTSGRIEYCGKCVKDLSQKKLNKWVGRKFGMLTVVKYDHREGKNTYWECLCDCGNTVIKGCKNLEQSTQFYSCGCKLSKDRFSVFYFNKLSPVQQSKGLYYIYKHEAQKRGYSFNLTPEEFCDITTQNCHYCGIEPKQKFKEHNREVCIYYYNGIDRVDNSIGYEFTNCVPSCGVCNRFKYDRTLDDFMKRVDNIYKNLNSKGLLISEEGTLYTG
jgi:hypothetical protein